jgi:tripartite-type tricarboxylate transporter receptor subunit TctC
MKILSIKQKARRRKIIIISVATVVFVVITMIALYFFVGFYGNLTIDIPEQITITVAWNPGSIADDMARATDFGDTQLVLQNIVGTHGANGLNAVYNAEHDGTTLLATGLTAFTEAERMGFAESVSDDWTWWLVAFSPESGEYYGLFVPSGVPQNRLNGLEQLITSAVETEMFIDFLDKWGLETVIPERN